VLLLVLGTLAPLRKGQGKTSCRIAFNIKRRDDVINSVPTLAYSEVEGAGSDHDRIAGGNEGCTVARPSKVFGQRLVADPGRRIITGQFEYVSDRRYLWKRGSRGEVFTTATCVPQPFPFESRTVAPASMMFSTTQEVGEEQGGLDSLPLTVNEKFPAGNGIDPPAIACEPTAKLIASAPKNIRRVFIGSPPVERKASRQHHRGRMWA